MSIIGFSQKQELTTTIDKSTVVDSSRKIKPKFSVEFEDGTSKRGRLVKVDDENQTILLANSSDTTSIDFKKVYNIRKDGFSGSTGMMYQLEAPERFFYSPMGNTMEEGMLSLESFFFLNGQAKGSPIDGLELGIGITLWPNETLEDTSVSAFVMGSIKYRVINRRHLKMAIGVEAIQLPPDLILAAGQFQKNAPWFTMMYTAANWEYRYMTFSFSAAQGYRNGVPLRQFQSLLNSDRGSDYMVTASASVKITPFIHAISENIYFAGAWNTLGSSNSVGKVNLFMPLVGGRYYGDYYSFALGVSNVLIPNAVVFFYVGGSYYFI